jgi:hypothetical protein
MNSPAHKGPLKRTPAARNAKLLIIPSPEIEKTNNLFAVLGNLNRRVADLFSLLVS